MKHLAHFSDLRINTDSSNHAKAEATGETGVPTTPGGSPTRSTHHTPTQSIRRSDTADSLNALIRQSPSLSNVRDLDALPSPILPPKNLFPRRNEHGIAIHSNRSPLSRGAAFGDASPLNLDNEDKSETDTVASLPLKLLARLQGDRNTRHVSLNVEQPVSDVEMPRLIRHRSQSQVSTLGDELMLHREPNLAVNQHDEVRSNDTTHYQEEAEVFNLPYDGESRKYIAVSQLGEGTFSRVLLARDQADPQKLVAIKAVELLASGLADKARVEMTVRREIDLLTKIHHPLIVQVHGSLVSSSWAYLVLEYCPGGDLFTFVSRQKSLLTPHLTRRIFAEIVTAVHYLHTRNIVHRDLKLENVLLRLDACKLSPSDLKSQLLTTVIDLGLAREFDPLQPDMITRCGSEDYAAPEIVMGQTYDGRQSDAWALGAILYCLLEGRLPFDVIPGLEHKMKSKVLHRICRIEWRWVALGEVDSYDASLEGAKRIVFNLLRSRTKRWTLNQVMKDEWLREEIELVKSLISRDVNL